MERRLKEAEGRLEEAEARRAKTSEELRRVQEDLQVSTEEGQILEQRCMHVAGAPLHPIVLLSYCPIVRGVVVSATGCVVLIQSIIVVCNTCEAHTTGTCVDSFSCERSVLLRYFRFSVKK